jgi:hypothetical protein
MLPPIILAGKAFQALVKRKEKDNVVPALG